MPCQICGKYSAFYPLCQTHFKMRDKGLVNKCKECGIWFEGSEDSCTDCKEGDKKAKDLVHINKKAFKQWASRLYAISQTGIKYNPDNEHDLKRYEKFKSIASQFYDLTKEEESTLISVEKNTVQKWCKLLYGESKKGLKYNPNDFDIERYNTILDIQEDLISTIEASEEDYSEIRIETRNDTKTKREKHRVDFLADREIRDEMVAMIERAEKDILIASPWIWESKDILDKLQNVADEKRVRVRILTRTAEGEKDASHKKTIVALHQCGFQIEHDFKVHSKLLLIDDKELLIGSANLVGTSLTRNYEMAVWTDNPETVMEAKMYFTDLMGEIFIKKIDKK